MGGLTLALVVTRIWAIALPVGWVAISWLIEWAVIRSRGTVDLHRGVVVRGWRWARQATFDHVDQVWLDMDPPPRVRLTRFDGETVIVPLQVEDSQALLDAIQHACSEQVLDEAKRALSEGAQLDFASLELDGDGYTMGIQRTRWRDVTELRFAGQTIDVLGVHGALVGPRIDLRRVPHPLLVIRLMKHLTGRT